MKNIVIFTLLFSLLWGISPLLAPVGALSWDFDKKSDADDWKAIRGEWSIVLKEGVFEGKSDLDEGCAIVNKKAWDDAWVDYTLEVRLRNMGTENHFGIGFRDDGKGNHYGFYLNDFKGPETKYWFGTFLNGRYQALAGSWAEDGNYKDAEAWNVMKVVVKGFTFDLYVNDKLLKSVTDPNKTFKVGPVALVSDKHMRTAIAQFDYVQLEGPGIPMAVEAHPGKLSTTWGDIKFSRLYVD
ncbi:TPA: DUF1080 domain-containing protein [Candidatus Poribacteria bacterium]|nr:DUF1080 domain-containing protein [Candidatus Poribacteria bacterium]